MPNHAFTTAVWQHPSTTAHTSMMARTSTAPPCVVTPAQHRRHALRRHAARLVAACAAAAWLAHHAAKPRRGRDPRLPLQERLQKLEAAQQRFAGLFPQVPLISCQEVHAMLQAQPAQVVVVDVRNAEERQVSMLPGSRVLTAAEFEQQRHALKHATAICYCTVGYRSSQFAKGLIESGQAALNMQGGIIGWTHARLPLVDGRDRRQQRPSARVHTYAERWAMQGDGFEPVYYTSSYLMMLRDVVKALAGSLGLGRA